MLKQLCNVIGLLFLMGLASGCGNSSAETADVGASSNEVVGTTTIDTVNSETANQTASSQETEDFVIDEAKMVPGAAEWNREIVAKGASSLKIQITSAAAKGVIILRTEAFNQMASGQGDQIDRDRDIVLVDDTQGEVYERVVEFPAAGSYTVMIENRSRSEQEIHFRCIQAE